MSLVAHKYTPAEMSDQELEATFAARGHTVDYLLRSLRDQIRSGTLSSFVITGPRGAGKSTLIYMVALRVRQDAELSAAWIPVVFPEEQFNVTSLRDLLAAVLRKLATDGLPEAKERLRMVEEESNEEQSEQLAITGLRELTRRTGKRLVLFVENLNLLLEESFDDRMKGALRRLLMVDPFMLLIGSSVRVFDSLKDYDEAFFNYFGPVPLARLDAAQVFELLKLRADFDGNTPFLRDFPRQQPKIRAVAQLSGGNPRLILMLYELLSARRVTTIVQCLRRLVDELTPLLKHEMEALPPQQRQIVHALMEKGGTAKPVELVGPTRLPLNAITSQLKRLKESQVVEVLGGGKGHPASYTVPDKLFAIWYQMRYLNQNRRRIELFVEVLRVWFEAEERFSALGVLANLAPGASPQALRDAATTAEYFAASLTGTGYEPAARDLAVKQWLRSGDYREAALAHADFSGMALRDEVSREASAGTDFGCWCLEHKQPKAALEVLGRVIVAKETPPAVLARALVARGCCRSELADHEGALADFSAVLTLDGAPKRLAAAALAARGVAKERLGDTQGAIADYAALVRLAGAPKEMVAVALVNRGLAKGMLGNTAGAIADFTALVMLDGAPKEMLARALVGRGFGRGLIGDAQGAITDCTAVLKLEGAPNEMVAWALCYRGMAKGMVGDRHGEIADYTAVMTVEGAPKEAVARAFLNRGISKVDLGDPQGAIADYTAVVRLDGSPKEQVAMALFNRGVAHLRLNRERKAINDWLQVIKNAAGADEACVFAARALFRVNWLNGNEEQANWALDRLAQGVGGLPKDECAARLTSFLAPLATPQMRQGWAHACRRLLATQPPEIKEALGFLDCVAAVVQGGDKSLLDPLPPEQREFAIKVLSDLEPTTSEKKPDGSPAPVQAKLP